MKPVGEPVAISPYAVVKDRVLLVGTGRIVAGVFADSPVSEGCRER
jgi:hypothetical protein